MTKRKKYNWEKAEPAKYGGECNLNVWLCWPDNERDYKLLEELVEERKNPNLSDEQKRVLDEQINAMAAFERLSR